MVKYCVNEASTLKWPFDQDLRYYAQLGIPAIAASRAKLEAYGVERGVRLVKDSGFQVAALLSTGFFTLDDRSQWPGQIEKAKRAMGIAAQLQAPTVVLLTGPCGSLSYEETEPRFLEVLAQLLPEAERHGLRLALEPNNCLRVDLGYIHNLHDALDLADQVDSPFFTICFETSNAWIERRLYENIRRRSRRIGLVQINDFKKGTQCTPVRVPLGDGIIPLDRIIRAFLGAGYDGYFDVEVLGPDVEAMGYEEALRRSLAWLQRFDG